VRRHEGRELVELSLRPQLLRDPDRGVRDDDPEEERVPPVRDPEGQDAEDEQDRVEDGEDVRDDDALRRPARRRRLDRATLREPPLRLGLGQAGGRGSAGGERRDQDPEATSAARRRPRARPSRGASMRA
jgi:hypothetical protein